MSAVDGGPAFPYSRLGSDCDGMTLRDYFAAKAMQAHLVDPEASSFTEAEIAHAAYQMADAMIRARGA